MLGKINSRGESIPLFNLTRVSLSHSLATLAAAGLPQEPSEGGADVRQMKSIPNLKLRGERQTSGKPFALPQHIYLLAPPQQHERPAAPFFHLSHTLPRGSCSHRGCSSLAATRGSCIPIPLANYGPFIYPGVSTAGSKRRSPPRARFAIKVMHARKYPTNKSLQRQQHRIWSKYRAFFIRVLARSRSSQHLAWHLDEAFCNSRGECTRSTRDRTRSVCCASVYMCLVCASHAGCIREEERKHAPCIEMDEKKKKKKKKKCAERVLHESSARENGSRKIDAGGSKEKS